MIRSGITSEWSRSFSRHFGKPPDQLGPDQLRTYQAYLLKVRKLAVGSVVNHVCALRFFFVRTLRRYEFRDYIPIPKERNRLPSILGKEEVSRMINASGNLYRRTLLIDALRHRHEKVRGRPHQGR
jgi:integrase/recombinase XerD